MLFKTKRVMVGIRRLGVKSEELTSAMLQESVRKSGGRIVETTTHLDAGLDVCCCYAMVTVRSDKLKEFTSSMKAYKTFWIKSDILDIDEGEDMDFEVLD